MTQRGPLREKQAWDLIYAIRDVANSLDHRRAAYDRAGPQERSYLRSVLLSDVDRLSNLMHLAAATSYPDLTPGTRETLEDELANLHRRTLRIGAGVALERIGELHETALQALVRRDHVIGQSLPLREEFMRHLNYLQSLLVDLPADHVLSVRASAEYINALIDRDRHVPWLQSLDETEPQLPFIDLDMVAFRLQPAEGEDDI